MGVCDSPLQWKHVGDGNYILKGDCEQPSWHYTTFDRNPCETWDKYMKRYFDNFNNKETTMSACCQEAELTYVFDVVVVKKSTKEVVHDETMICGSKKDAEKLALADIAAGYAGKDLSDSYSTCTSQSLKLAKVLSPNNIHKE